MAVLGGVAVSYEQGAPVGPYGGPRGRAVSYDRGTPVAVRSDTFGCTHLRNPVLYKGHRSREGGRYLMSEAPLSTCLRPMGRVDTFGLPHSRKTTWCIPPTHLHPTPATLHLCVLPHLPRRIRGKIRVLLPPRAYTLHLRPYTCARSMVRASPSTSLSASTFFSSDASSSFRSLRRGKEMAPMSSRGGLVLAQLA